MEKWRIYIGKWRISLEKWRIYIYMVMRAFRPPVLCVFWRLLDAQPTFYHQLCICTWWGPIRRNILDIHEWFCLAMPVTLFTLWGVQNQEALQIHVGLCDLNSNRCWQVTALLGNNKIITLYHVSLFAFGWRTSAIRFRTVCGHVDLANGRYV